MVQAFGAIANGGTLMAPRVIQEVRDPDGQLQRREEPRSVRRVLSPKTASVLQGMLRRVVSEGTGRKAAIEGVDVAGKTGTAQRALPGGGGYARGEYIASFIGFLPATGQPRYLCLISVENPRIGKWGGVVAAPAFRRTMERVLVLDGSQAPGRSKSGSLAAAKPAAGGEVVPDLRGLDVSRARTQARRRDLTLRFEGSGAIVIDQEPAPRSRSTEASILCRLGNRADLFALGRPEAPMRQAVLLRKLRGTQLMALSPGESAKR
jgi:stage V sporulation protein D (sporulation-specific penicillin-binding protein)